MLTGMASAQVVTVIDGDTKEPLELVVLASSSTRSIVMTNAEGHADISGFTDADVIEVRSLGYKTVQLTYLGLESMNFLISLQREDISLDQIVVSGSKWSQGSREVPSKI